MAKYLIAILESSISPSIPEQLKVLVSLEVITNMYKRLFMMIDKNAAVVIEHFDDLSKDVEQGKVRV